MIKFCDKKQIFWSFAACLLYWIYLFFTSHMAILCDSINYEYLGRLLYEKGWIEYFKTGPHREPFYPMLIAFSMKVGATLGISYQMIQILIQFLILFLTQILTLHILKILKINNFLCAMTILYLGISPALVNSALSLFSEIATYPLILVIVLLIYKSWLAFTGPRFRIIILAIVVSLLFVLMVLNKGIFELVGPVFLFFLLVSVFLTRNFKLIVNALVYFVIVLVIFYSLVNGYKLTNEIFNGHFTVTSRGAWALYGSTARRMEPLTNERFLTALASVPGENVCQSIFNAQKCSFWFYGKIDEYGSQKTSELGRNKISPEVLNNTLISLSKQKILQYPIQYILLVMIEGLKMFFWESTQIGFVGYPAGLTKLFSWTPFRYGLRLGISFLTVLAIACLVTLLWGTRKDILKTESPLLLPYLCFLFILSFVSSYALFGIIVRYLFPIVPLYLIIIVYVFQKACFRVQNSA